MNIVILMMLIMILIIIMKTEDNLIPGDPTFPIGLHLGRAGQRDLSLNQLQGAHHDGDDHEDDNDNDNDGKP